MPQAQKNERKLAAISRESDFIAEYRRGSLLPLDIDPRIDMTKPIYEQAMKLQAKGRAPRRKRTATAA
jgi:hypothetical protein